MTHARKSQYSPLMNGIAFAATEDLSHPVFKGKGGKARMTSWNTLIWDTLVFGMDQCVRVYAPARADYERLVEAGFASHGKKPNTYIPCKYISGSPEGEA